jgi:uncharacterized protein YaiI (UPF0178 family)
VTRDVALAARLLERGCRVIDDRGSAFTQDNIHEKMSLRDFQVGIAEAGLGMQAANNYGKKELKHFADAFDRALTAIQNGHI